MSGNFLKWLKLDVNAENAENATKWLEMADDHKHDEDDYVEELIGMAL